MHNLIKLSVVTAVLFSNISNATVPLAAPKVETKISATTLPTATAILKSSCEDSNKPESEVKPEAKKESTTAKILPETSVATKKQESVDIIPSQLTDETGREKKTEEEEKSFLKKHGKEIGIAAGSVTAVVLGVLGAYKLYELNKEHLDPAGKAINAANEVAEKAKELKKAVKDSPIATWFKELFEEAKSETKTS